MIYTELSKMFKKDPIKRPHVVILGAGASKACCKIDKNGKALPTMLELSKQSEIISILNKNNIDISLYNNNFETLFSKLCTDTKYNDLVKELEQIIFNYFSSIQIPDAITIYDELIMSLRSKDVIASFNWDPLLHQAYMRCGSILQNIDRMPRLLYLHGSVALGYCEKDLIMWSLGTECIECGKKLQPTKLLYPVEKKNYQDNSIIQASWDDLQRYITNAFFITIFGYSAPATDVEALELLKNAYKENKGKEFIETEIIDIKDVEDLERTWEGLYYSHHKLIYKSFYDSYIFKYPRRSCEAIYLPIIMGGFPPQEIKRKSVNSIYDFVHQYDPLIEEELSL